MEKMGEYPETELVGVGIHAIKGVISSSARLKTLAPLATRSDLHPVNHEKDLRYVQLADV